MRVLCFALAVLVAGLCQSSPALEPAEGVVGRRSVVFIVSDALRADVLGCYGGPAVTPNIDRIAANGVLFEQAFSNATWTVPSCASIFTGRHPNAFPYEMIVKNNRERQMCRIPQEAVTIWKELATRGYDLSCYIENGLVTYTGALHGIGTELSRKGVEAAEREQIDDMLGEDAYRYKQKYYPVLDHLLKIPKGKPFFLLVWFLDPHAPYRPPREDEGDISTRYSHLPEGVGFYRDLTAFEIRDMGHGFSDEEARLLRELYLGEVESIDGRVGNIIRAVKHMGRLEDTYFVFTSDHGEAFREHGRFVHGGPGFYRELIHVPLIVAGPDLAEGQEIGRMVSHVQLIPTIRTLLDLAPGRGLPAPSLVDPAGGMHGDSRPLYFSGTSDSCYAVLDGDWKLMVNGSDLRLFNLFGDPGELTDVFHNFPGVAARLTEIGRRITADNTAHRIAVEGLSEAGGEQEAELQEIKKTLRSLGYIR